MGHDGFDSQKQGRQANVMVLEKRIEKADAQPAHV
jgi:hypothetical protein